MTRSGRSRLRRHPEREVADPVALASILDAGVVAHVGITVDGEPVVIPLLLHHEDGTVYLHGSQDSRMLRHLASGAPVCVAVTVVDDLVASRSAFNHSANYRSAVVFGHGAEVRDPVRKRAVLDRMIARYFPERAVGVDYTPATERELRATRLVAVTVEEMSGKARSGPAAGPNDAEDPGDGTSTYVVPAPGALRA